MRALRPRLAPATLARPKLAQPKASPTSRGSVLMILAARRTGARLRSARRARANAPRAPAQDRAKNGRHRVRGAVTRASAVTSRYPSPTAIVIADRTRTARIRRTRIARIRRTRIARIRRTRTARIRRTRTARIRRTRTARIRRTRTARIRRTRIAPLPHTRTRPLDLRAHPEAEAEAEAPVTGEAGRLTNGKVASSRL